MGLFKRVSDIVSANLNEMIESWEDPETMLKQAIREMETSIDSAKRDVAKTMANEKLLSKRLAENERQSVQWQTRAETAVAAGDDALARQAILRRQENEKIAASLADEHAVVDEAALTLRRQLEAMQAKEAEAKRRLGTLVARKKAAAVQTKIQMANREAEWNQDAFAKFDRLREKVELAEAEAEALRELSGDPVLTDSLSAEVAGRDLAVEGELQKLKQKLQSPTA